MEEFQKAFKGWRCFVQVSNFPYRGMKQHCLKLKATATFNVKMTICFLTINSKLVQLSAKLSFVEKDFISSYRLFLALTGLLTHYEKTPERNQSSLIRPTPMPLSELWKISKPSPNVPESMACPRHQSLPVLTFMKDKRVRSQMSLIV